MKTILRSEKRKTGAIRQRIGVLFRQGRSLTEIGELMRKDRTTILYHVKQLKLRNEVPENMPRSYRKRKHKGTEHLSEPDEEDLVISSPLLVATDKYLATVIGTREAEDRQFELAQLLWRVSQ